MSNFQTETKEDMLKRKKNVKVRIWSPDAHQLPNRTRTLIRGDTREGGVTPDIERRWWWRWCRWGMTKYSKGPVWDPFQENLPLGGKLRCKDVLGLISSTGSCVCPRKEGE